MLISHSFKHGHMSGDLREVFWGDSEDAVALRLAYTNSGRFTAHPEAALTDRTAATLIREIEALESGGEPMVWRKVCFAALPVEGFFRYRDAWQIRAVPDDAPRPPFVIAPQPFILEVKGSSVPERFVGWMRGGKLLWETELILALLVQGGLDSDSSTIHQWVIDMGGVRQGSEPSTVFGQVGYSMPQMPGPADDFSSVEGIEELRLVSTNDYLARRGISVDQTLDIPDITASFCDTLSAAKPATRERFFAPPIGSVAHIVSGVFRGR